MSSVMKSNRSRFKSWPHRVPVNVVLDRLFKLPDYFFVCGKIKIITCPPCRIVKIKKKIYVNFLASVIARSACWNLRNCGAVTAATAAGLEGTREQTGGRKSQEDIRSFGILEIVTVSREPRRCT